jgi:hypothetical protein
MTDPKPANDLQPPPSNLNVPPIDPIKTSAETLGDARVPSETVAQANAKAASQTHPHQSTGDDVKEPHERDESGDSQHQQTPANNDMIGQAKKDVDAGLKDTDRRPPMDPLYERQKEGSDDSATGAPRK